MQSSFHAVVASRYGFTRPATGKGQSRAVREKAAALVLESLRGRPERLKEPNVREALRAVIAANPEPLLLALGLDVPEAVPKKGRSWVEIMTQPAKPEPKQKPIQNPIGFVQPETQQSQRSEPYLCVGFANSAGVANEAEPVIEATYYREEEETGEWSGELGEFIQLPARKQAGSAHTWAAEELKRMGVAIQT